MFHFALRNEIRDTAAAEPLDHRFLGFLFLFDYGRRGFGRLMPHASGGGLRRWVEYLYEYLYYSDYGQKPRFYCVERLGFDSCLRHQCFKRLAAMRAFFVSRALRRAAPCKALLAVPI